RAVVVHDERLHQRRRGPPGAHIAELGPDVVDGLAHLLPGFLQHQAGELLVHHRTSVPIRSPASARRRLPGPIRSNTRMGRLLSLQKVMAVRSITRRSLATTSMK